MSQTLNKLARLQEDRGSFIEAESLFREALAMRVRIYGDDHPETATILNNLGWLMYVAGRLDEAEPLLQRALRTRRRHLPHPHSDTATTLNNLAVLKYGQGDLAQAHQLLYESLEIDLASRGGVSGEDGIEHPNITSTKNNIAMVLLKQGRAEEALPMLKNVVDARRLQLGDHPLTAQSLINLATALGMNGQHEEAHPLVQQAVDVLVSIHGERHPDVADAMSVLATVDIALGREPIARSRLEAALDILREHVDEDDHRIVEIKQQLLDIDSRMPSDS